MVTPYTQVDGVTLYHGDCLQITEWLAGDVLVTDPPYGIGWARGEHRARSSVAHAGIAGDRDVSCRNAALAMWGNRPAVVFGSLYAPAPPMLRHVLIWEKAPDAGVVGSTTGYRRDVEAIYLTGPWPPTKARSGSVLRSGIRNNGSPNSPAGRTGHPHSKPLDLIETLLVTAPPGVITDPFAGSGSTLLAARNQGRAAIGVEIEERYCELIATRLAQTVLL